MAAGAVAGHYAHHHAVVGAMAGCAAGHYYYKHKAHVAAAHKLHIQPEKLRVYGPEADRLFCEPLFSH